MKMTNEEKQAFFAQYWGQRVGARDFVKDLLVGEFAMQHNTIDYLELRTVEMLTDVELILYVICGGVKTI